MRCVITGGAGFLGSHLVEAMLNRGANVVVIDNLITGNVDNLAGFSNSSQLEVRIADVTQFLAIDGPIDLVVHFASPASPKDFDRFPIQILKAGALGTHNTLGLARAKGSRYLLASTSEVYGDPLVHPQPETYWGNVNPIGPRGVYDEAKRYAEAMVMAYHRMHGLDTRIARFFNTYGPRMRTDDGRLIPSFLSAALSGRALTVFGDGRQTRSFGYVSDIIEGALRLIDSNYHGPVNIGSDEELSVREVVEVFCELLDVPLQVEFLPQTTDDPKSRRPDLTLAKSVLDWTPTVRLREGLAKTVEAFRTQSPQDW